MKFEFSAAHFAKRNTKFGGGGEARALASFSNVPTVGFGLSACFYFHNRI